MTHPYTPAQVKALAWLPADGRWQALPKDSAATSFCLFRIWEVGLAELKEDSLWGDQIRLTPAGIAERARLVAAGEIK